MTLLMALANQDYSLVLGDRRLVSNGKVAEDEANKVCVLFCNDARVAIAYTGLAAYANLRTQDWLRDTLADISKDKYSLDDILSEFQARASRVYAQIPGQSIAFLISGFRYSDVEGHVACLISNFDPHASKFEVRPSLNRYELDSSGTIVAAQGYKSVLSYQDYDSLRKMLQAGNSAPKVLRKAIQIFRRASGDKRSRGFIGPQCNSAVVPREPNTNIVSTYHSSHAVFRAHSADVVVAVTGCGFVVTGMSVMSPDILAGPEIKEGDDCWCGSGKKFKACHLRKFGSVYARVPGFKKPMVMVAGIKAKNPVSSGIRFVVTSGFA